MEESLEDFTNNNIYIDETKNQDNIDVNELLEDFTEEEKKIYFEEIKNQGSGNIIYPVEKSQLDIQRNIIEFITSTILLNEINLFDLLNNNYPSLKKEYIETNNKTIFSMISELIKDFFNKLYDLLKNKKSNECIEFLETISKDIKQNTYYVLDKLFRLVTDIHMGINRSELESDNIDLLKKTVLVQINIVLSSINLSEIFYCKEIDFLETDESVKNKTAFDIKICDKQ